MSTKRDTLHPLSPNDRLEAVRRACLRRANTVTLEMKRGIRGLATLAGTASLVGFFGTVVGMFGAFPGCSGEVSTCNAATIAVLSNVLVPTEIGLFTATLAYWFYKYLNEKSVNFEIEMINGSSELIGCLSQLFPPA